MLCGHRRQSAAKTRRSPPRQNLSRSQLSFHESCPMDPTFEVLVESERTEAELLDALQLSLHGARQGGYLLVQGNVLKFSENPLRDRSKLGNGERSWPYLKYSLSVFPQREPDLAVQNALANEVVAALRPYCSVLELIAEAWAGGAR